jgi:hypothetical protein
MELSFNELGIYPLSPDTYRANDKMKIFSEAVSAARKNGFNIIRSHYDTYQIMLSENYTLSQWLYNKEIPRDYRDLLYGIFTLPFIKEDDEEIEDKYIEANYFFEDNESNIEKTKCLGLASAYLYDTLSISLASLPIWQKTKLKILIEKDGETLTHEVFNISEKDSFQDQNISLFVENLGEVNLIETKIIPDDKKIHLADHHGKDKLQALCNQLKYNLHVEEMRSMEWCRGRCNDFIKKCHKDGVVEIVLFKTDMKYALWVKTTGRNLRETKTIAEKLKNDFN